MDSLLEAYHRTSHAVQTASTTGKKILGFAYREMNKPTNGIPLSQRLSLISRGFHSTRALDYDLEEYELSDYLPDFSGAISPGSLAGRDAAIAKNKLTFQQALGEFHSDAMPNLYGIIQDGIIRSRQGEYVSDDLVNWLRNQVPDSGKLVCKPVSGVGGADVYVLSHSENQLFVNGREAAYDDFDTLLDTAAPYLVSEFVQQAEYAAEIYPDSTNTIRILTLQDPKTHEPFVARAIHRFGVDISAPVDNWDKGGLSVNIDVHSGEFTSAAQNTDQGIQWITSHPDTGSQITGSEVPEWETVREKTVSMASQLQQLPLIGWDIVLTESGVKVLEGNIRPTHDMMQIHEPFLKNPRVKEFFEHHGVV